LIIEESGEKRVYKIHAEFKFDSDRKRMSVIVEDNGEFFLYTKGADNKMISVIEWDNPEENKVLKKHLHEFAIKGLRTLVMGSKKLNKQTFNQIIEEISNIQGSDSTNKDELFTELYCKHEIGLKYVGASAIEDKLQDKVPETIKTLMECNIRVWVLTGDKQETAIEIAKSCQLIQDEMEVIELTLKMEDIKPLPSEPEKEFKIRKLNLEKGYKEHLAKTIKEKKEQTVDPNVNYKEEADIFKKPMKDLVKRGQQITIVIDGPTLALILGDEELEKKFLSIGLYSKSVVCCRVSPKQKSMVVHLAKKYKKGCIRLAIGDGANDVPMIMEANIGVGIRGKEGTQAVRSSDYAISQFKYLQKLVLFHGRLGYRRVSWVI
jgi:phospholipid-translocating ATPase